MITITNGSPSNGVYPATVGGDMELEILNQNSSTYTVRCYGLTSNYFDFSVAKAEVDDSNGDFDSEKCFNWLMVEMKCDNEVASQSSGYGGSIDAEFQQFNSNTNRYELNLSGDFEVKEISDNGTDKTIRFYQIDNEDWDFKIESTHQAADPINPEKLLKWLLKMLKKYLCPECL